MVWPYRRYGRQGIRTGFPESVRFGAEHDQYVTTQRPSYRAVKNCTSTVARLLVQGTQAAARKFGRPKDGFALPKVPPKEEVYSVPPTLSHVQTFTGEQDCFCVVVTRHPSSRALKLHRRGGLIAGLSDTGVRREAR